MAYNQPKIIQIAISGFDVIGLDSNGNLWKREPFFEDDQKHIAKHEWVLDIPFERNRKLLEDGELKIAYINYNNKL
jgi:hypothetical protein